MMRNKRKISLKSITAPGYRFAGIYVGIKETKKPDLAFIVSDRPAKAVGYFTTNRVKAAPVFQGKQAVKNGRLQAVIVNSGNANAVTGPGGLKDAFRTAQAVGKALGISEKDVLVSSTGKIGVPLPIKKILHGIPHGVKSLSYKGLSQTAKAILTTDRFEKVFQVKDKIQGRPFTITGIAKGAGMIEPNMATMLAYILTDLDIVLPLMRKIFFQTIQKTFNSITVDGDSSTNDTALLLANGVSGISLRSKKSPGIKRFEEGLCQVCQALAVMMVEDGEGATKVVEIDVKGAGSASSAKRIAYAIAHSQLVKTSFFGEDPNWGRVFAAVGYSGETMDPSKVDIYYGKVPLVKGGNPTAPKNENLAHKVMKKPTFSVTVDLNMGKGEAKVWTSDLSYKYVKINSEYST